MSNILLALLVSLLAMQAMQAAGQTIPFWDTDAETIKLCTAETTPMVFCKGRQPAEFSGYEIELARRVFQILGWKPSMLEWRCMDWNGVVTALANDTGECDIGVAGLSVGTDSLDKGITFSWPTYSNGLGIMVPTTTVTAGLFAFMEAFSWQVWVATLLTIATVGVVVWMLDYALQEGSRPPRRAAAAGGDITKFAWARGAGPGGGADGDDDDMAAPVTRRDLERYFWEAMTRGTQGRDHIAASFPGNFVIFVFSFMMLVLVTLYTANTTANITATRLHNTIRGLADLPGRVVGAWVDDVPVLKSYNINALAFPWESAADEEAMLHALGNGTVAALVLDDSFLRYTAASRCSVAVVGQPFHLFNQAVAFRSGLDNPALVDAYNAALVALQESGQTAALVQQWVTPNEAECKISQAATATTKITFNQVAGLWISLAVVIALAAGMVAVRVAYLRWVHAKVQAASARVMSSAKSWGKRASGALGSSFGSKGSQRSQREAVPPPEYPPISPPPLKASQHPSSTAVLVQ